MMKMNLQLFAHKKGVGSTKIINLRVYSMSNKTFYFLSKNSPDKLSGLFTYQ